jgi:Rha family phage regulatory protein
VSIKDGKPVTTSLIVAESFGKEHRNVLRDIDNIIASSAYQERIKGGLLNFEQTPYIDPQNGQSYRMFEMDRQGFEILAMGFTGEEALRWKFQYSDAFAAMEQSLKSPPSHPHDPIAAQLADFLKGKVLVDYGALAVFARLTRAGWAKIAEGQALLEEAEQRGLALEKQCGQPLIKFDIPQDRLARYQQAMPTTAAPIGNKRKDPEQSLFEFIASCGRSGARHGDLHRGCHPYRSLPTDAERQAILESLLRQKRITTHTPPSSPGARRKAPVYVAVTQ